jgi:hypothetical protein
VSEELVTQDRDFAGMMRFSRLSMKGCFLGLMLRGKSYKKMTAIIQNFFQPAF